MDSPVVSPAPERGTGPQDLILVQRALRSERDAVEEVLSRFSCVVRFVYRLNRSLGYGLRTDVLEDVVQQVYMALWSRLRDFAGSAALESWAYGFCRNCVRAEARKRAQSLRVVAPLLDDAELQEVPAREIAPEDRLAQFEGVDALYGELERLDHVERQAVTLRHIQGWSFEQIARELGLAASTVKDRCYRALIKLRARLRRRDVHA